MKTRNFYIPQGSGVLNGVKVSYNEVNVLCINGKNGIEFLKTKQGNLINTIKKVFFIRGLFLFFYNLYVFFKDYAFSFKSYSQDLLSKDIEFRRAKKKELANFRITLTLSLIVVLFLLPALFDKFLGSVLDGVLFVVLRILFKFAIFSLLILFLKKQKILANVFENSGAINKVLNSLIQKNNIDYKKVDNSSRIWVVNSQTGFITTFFLLFTILPFFFSQNIILCALKKIVVAILIICIAYEIQLVVEYNYKNSKLLYAIGFLFIYFSYITTIEPKDEQKKLAKIAVEEVIQMNFDKVNSIDKSIGEVPFSKVLGEVKTTLIENGIDDSAEAKYLICETLGIDKTELVLLRSITKKQEEKILKVLNERITHKPLCKILGYKYFYGLKFKVNNFVLSPRQETEILVEEALNIINSSKKKLKVLDMCTGSGAIAVAIKKNSTCEMVAVDKCKRALSVATKNASDNGVDIQFFQGDMFKYLKDENKFDIITCNPPYIESKEIENLDKEVKNYDPLKALDGGADGLKFYKIIAKEAHKFLENKGHLLLEIGFDQAESVSKLLEENFKDICVIEDFAGLPRIIKAVRR